MAKPITIPNTFASATSAIPLSQLDQDFSTLANATNDLATYSNYVADTGAADAYIANFPANTNTASLTAGLTVQFKAANANTGASTLNVQVNGSTIGTAAIRYANGSALAAGAIAAGAMVSVMYDGTNFQLINDPAGQSGGDVTGPASATDNAIARFDGTTGKLIQNSVVTIADTTGDMSGVGTLSAGNVTVSGTANAATLIVTGNSTLGDASGDTLTITGTTVTTPNGLNFDSNTLVIDAANNRVGVNNATPTTALDVTGTATISTNLAFTGTGNRITGDFSNATIANRVAFQSSTTNGNTGVFFIPNGTAVNANIQVVNNSDPTNASITQVVANATESSLRASITGTGTYLPLTMYTNGSERLRIDTSGNVGIGTSSPSSFNSSGLPLVVGSGSGNTGLTIYSGTAASGSIHFADGTISTDSYRGIVAYSHTSNYMTFWTDATERMRITSAGQLLVGATTSGFDSTAYAIVGSGSSDSGLAIFTSNATAGYLQFADGTSGAEEYRGFIKYDHSTNAMSFSTNSTARTDAEMTIDSSGNVGIGTSSPGSTLNVAGVIRSTRADFSKIELENTTSASFWVAQNSGGNYTLGNGSTASTTERMRIDSSGNLGIGTTTPSFWSGRLTVDGGNIALASAGRTLFWNSGGTGIAAIQGVGTNELSFQTSNSYTERMRIDSSGRLLIGNTASNAAFAGKLQVEGTSDAFVSFVRYSSSAGGAPGLYLARSKSATLGTNTIVASGDTLGTIVFAGANGTGYSDAAYIQCLVDGTPGASADMPGRLVFFTSADGSATPTERMRIDSSGNVGIGVSNLANFGTGRGVQIATSATSQASSLFLQNGTTGTTGTDGLLLQMGSDNTSGYLWNYENGTLVFATNNTERMRITSGGQFLVATTSGTMGTSGKTPVQRIANSSNALLGLECTGTSSYNMILFNNGNGEVGTINTSGSATIYSTSSDYRLKENIAPMTGALSVVAQLKPCTYNWKVDGSSGQGFIAHELQEFAPYAVSGEKDGKEMQGVDYGKITPLLTAALQEAIAKIESLEARLAALESK